MVYISYILVWSNIPHSIPTERQLANILFQTRCLYLFVFDFWPGHSRVGCSRLLTVCSRLLTVCSRLLMVCSRFPRFLLSPLRSFWVLTRFLLGPYEGLLTVAHGLLTVAHGCSRFAHGCSRFAHALGKALKTHVQNFKLTSFERSSSHAMGLTPVQRPSPIWKIPFEPKGLKKYI